ncbi:tannase and feruloyl esterase [Mycena galopus ATCC 62051]|nr:tannase and feruloyl esterase [Mycena galopus ATCC 62051]
MVNHLWVTTTILGLLPALVHAAADPSAKCLALQNTLVLENTTILDVTYVPSPANISTAGSCQSFAPVTAAPLCRVYLVVNTSATSSVRAEAWLPDRWYGRFLGVGNGGLNGCIEYADLDYATSLHFAAIGSDNGHDGPNGLPFLNHPEVIDDFAFRAIHVEAVIGKQLVQAYYGTPAAKSYFTSCSTGGRQGMQAALKYPADFDGILAGSPATDFNHLLGWAGLLAHYIGATSPDNATTMSPKFLTPELWSVVSAEILRQCDGLDGVLDGIITEPDNCNFDMDPIRCGANASNTTDCLTENQADTITDIYNPLVGVSGEFIYPRFSPGAEADPTAATVFGGLFSSLAADWERYAVLNVTEYDFSNYSVQDIAQMDAINPGGVATFDGDLSAFRAQGGRFITYHGRRDPLVSSTNSKRVYDLISDTLSLAPAPAPDGMDAFYRLFLVPGMGHCFGGLGPTSFGQGLIPGTNVVNDTAHNILLALVDWVEGGDAAAPETITGSVSLAAGDEMDVVDPPERTFCRYPIESSQYGGDS